VIERRNEEIGPRPRLERGDEVIVSEKNRHPWAGTVSSVKPGAMAWWVEIESEESGLTWQVPAEFVEGDRWP